MWLLGVDRWKGLKMLGLRLDYIGYYWIMYYVCILHSSYRPFKVLNSSLPVILEKSGAGDGDLARYEKIPSMTNPVYHQVATGSGGSKWFQCFELARRAGIKTIMASGKSRSSFGLG